MKLRLILPLLACAALGVAWWLGRSEERGSVNVPAPVQAPPAEHDEAASLRVPSSAPIRSTEGGSVAASVDSTRTPSPDVAPRARTFTLRGTVRDERDAPVEACQVVATPRHPKDDPEPERRPIRRELVLGGDFAFDSIEPGAWFVHAERGEQRTDYAFVDVEGTDTPVELRLVSPVRVAGVVLDPDGRPLSRGRVVANSLAGGGERLQDCVDAGRFEFPALAAGSMVVYARADDCAPSEEQRIELAPGEERTDLVLRLRRGARLAGVVLGDDGSPLAGSGLGLEGRERSKTKSDELGRFAFDRLPPGDYVVFLSAELRDGRRRGLGRSLGGFTLAEGEFREVVLGGPSSAIPMVLVSGMVLSGGAPCSGAHVGLGSDGGGPEAVRTDEAGRFVLHATTSGSLLFLVAKEGVRTLQRREVPPAGVVDLVFELPAAEIVGRVLGPEGHEAPGVPLVLTPDDEGSQLWGLTDANGSFALRGITPGSYGLTAGEYLAERENWAPVEQHVTIGADEHLELELTLLAAARLRGTVRTTDGRVFPGATVLALAPKGRLSNAWCDSQGNYALGSLVPGRLRVLARTLESCSAWREVEVRGGEVLRLDLELAPMVRVEIETVDERGEPVAARISIEDCDGREVDPRMADLSNDGTESQGRASLPPGDYRVVAMRKHAPVMERRPLHLVGPGPELVRIVLAGPPRPGK